MSAKDALNHPWFYNKIHLEKLTINVVYNLKQFRIKTKLKYAIEAYIAS